MTLVNPSTESLIRFLAYLGGVASTLVGSWVSSKIHVYQENKKAHLEDIRQKVLIPLSGVLANEYILLVTHKSSAVCLAKTSYTRKVNDLAKSSIRTVPIRFLP